MVTTVSATAPVWRYADATSGTPLASFAYGYNADGQVTSYTGPEGTLNYSYDKDGELTGVLGAAQATYSYDANGNRTLSGYQTGPGNELLSDGQFTYTYDKDGNLLSKRDASGDVWSYSWDYRNRLTEVKETNAQGVVVLDEQFVYDVNDHLIGEAVNGVPQRWTVYDGSTPYLDLTGGGQVSERYLADPNVLSAYWARVGVTGQADWMVTDLLGSVRELVSAGGSVEDQINYDAYGNIVTETNAAAGGRLKYAGGQYDGGLGLTLFGARWYNSAAGRWLSQDPLGLGPDSNPYRYVYNSPANGTDPSGLCGRWRGRFYRCPGPIIIVPMSPPGVGSPAPAGTYIPLLPLRRMPRADEGPVPQDTQPGGVTQASAETYQVTVYHPVFVIAGARPAMHGTRQIFLFILNRIGWRISRTLIQSARGSRPSSEITGDPLLWTGPTPPTGSDFTRQAPPTIQNQAPQTETRTQDELPVPVYQWPSPPQVQLFPPQPDVQLGPRLLPPLEAEPLIPGSWTNPRPSRPQP
jgi:RHS repeat-associated protein